MQAGRTSAALSPSLPAQLQVVSNAPTLLASLYAAQFREACAAASTDEVGWGYVKISDTPVGVFDVLIGHSDLGVSTERYGDLVVMDPGHVKLALSWMPASVTDEWILDQFILADDLRKRNSGSIRLGWVQGEQSARSLQDLSQWAVAAGLANVKVQCEGDKGDPEAWVFECESGGEWTLRGTTISRIQSLLAENSPTRKQQAVKAPLKASPKLELDELGRTSLHHAAREGNKARLQTILEKGVEPGFPDFSFHSALHLAAMADATECIQLLIQHGAEWRARNNKGKTALHLAAEYGATGAATALMAAGADPNTVMDKDITPLHLASWNGHTSVIEALLRHGADITRVNQDGNTCLHFAAGNGQIKVLKVLIGFGANAEETNHRGLTYLEVVNDGYSGDPIPVMD